MGNIYLILVVLPVTTVSVFVDKPSAISFTADGKSRGSLVRVSDIISSRSKNPKQTCLPTKTSPLNINSKMFIAAIVNNYLKFMIVIYFNSLVFGVRYEIIWIGLLPRDKILPNENMITFT